MRIPDCLASLSEYGIIEEVLRPLMSGKEAQIYLVISGGEQRVAKVYKEAQNRTFKNRAEYTEGRKVRNSRDQRAMGKGTRHGRAQEEAAWRATEVEMIYRLRDAGVRVPVPYHFIDSVLIMEMVADTDGNPAPRLGDLDLAPAEAQVIFERLLAEVVRMLSAGVVHGDLSDFNVLIGADGPVVIDFPQSVDASSNQNARKLLVRDVENLHRFMARFFPEHRALPYAQEMWQLYERGELLPDTKLTGRHRASEKKADTRAVLELIGDANYDESKRRQKLGLKTRGGPSEIGDGAQPGSPPARAGVATQSTGSVPARRVERDVTPQGRRGAAPSSDRADASSDRRHAGYELQRREAVSPHERSHTDRESKFREAPLQQSDRAASVRNPNRRDAPSPQQRTDRGAAPRDLGYREAPPLSPRTDRAAATRDSRVRDAAPRDSRVRDTLPRASDSASRDTRYRDGPPSRDIPSRESRYRDGPLHQTDRGAAPRDERYRDAPQQRPQQSERGAAPRDERYRDAPQRPQQSDRGAAPRDERYRDAPQQSDRGAAPRDERYRDAPQQTERGVGARDSNHRDASRGEDQAQARGRFSGSRKNWS
jgi:RIO kinase 1